MGNWTDDFKKFYSENRIRINIVHYVAKLLGIKINIGGKGFGSSTRKRYPEEIAEAELKSLIERLGLTHCERVI